MKASVPLGRWLGVPVGLHYSWFLIAGLITTSLAAQFTRLNPAWPTGTVWVLAVITSLLFFVSIVLHELGHATVARVSGVPVKGITLFALGGIAQLERDANTAGKEFAIAIAGPVASVAIGFVCQIGAGLGATPIGAPPTALSAVLGWLGYINVALAVFNLIPGFPLDGGRVLRAIAWRLTGRQEKATRIAARTGMVFAFGFILVGIFRLLTGGDFGGLWLAFIGWFLLDAAQGQYAATMVTATLQGMRVADVMAHDCPAIDAGLTVQQFVDHHLLRSAERCYAVEQNGSVVGFVSPEEVKAVDKAQWGASRLGDLVRPVQSGHTVPPEAPAAAALTLMSQDNVNEVPVVSNGHIAGVVTRAHILQLLQLRAELS